PPEPPALDSEKWERDYDQVRILGDVNSNVRTAEQSEIGLFWTEHTGQQYARAFGYLAGNYKLDVSDTARLMAVLWTGYADSVIGCFNAKYTYSFWRPVTAIRAGGGNPELTVDPRWTPLRTTPNPPEYPAANGCVTGTVSHLIEGLFHTPKVHIVTDSLVTGTIHTFESTDALLDEVFWARIFAGFHYHNSMVEGSELGSKISRQL